jgi:hypothetical protein
MAKSAGRGILARLDDVVPVAMELVSLDVQLTKFLAETFLPIG